MKYFKDHFNLDIVNEIVESTLAKLSKATSDDEKREILRSIIIDCYCDGNDIIRNRFARDAKNKID